MLIHRLGDHHEDRNLYDGHGILGLERYFLGTNKLGPYVMRYEFAPGTSEGEHLHDAKNPNSCTVDDSDEMYIVTRGELVITCDGQETTLHSGDAFYAPAGSVHGVHNRSQEQAELILVFGAPRPTS